jgi:diguanylate cyclase (GGDEF)-like protein
LKHETKGFDEITNLIARLKRNRHVKALIVEDSATQRMKLKKILRTHNFDVVEAEDGVQALRRMEENPDIKLVLTDYNMPEMNGYELVKELRLRFDRDRLAILGLSDMGNPILSAKFLKTGANDFVSKPFVVEELMARVTSCVDMLEMVQKLRDLAIKDPLTRLHNRRYFFDEAEKKFRESKKNGTPFAVGMLDIDHFKKINDTYGHDAGDKVLEILADALHEDTRGADIVARFGGEEFCIATPDTDKKGAEILFEKIRRHAEALSLDYGDHNIRFTVSIGVCTSGADTLEFALKQSDEMLYTAKSRGRNRVVADA